MKSKVDGKVRAIDFGPILAAGIMKSNGGRTMSEADYKGEDEGDRVGASDGRSDYEKAAQLAEVCRAAFAKPPLPTEDVARWLLRVFGRDGCDQLFSDQLFVLRKVFEALKQNIQLRKSAAAALDAIGAEIRSVEPALSYYQSFAKACRTAAGSELYALLKRRLIPENTASTAAGYEEDNGPDGDGSGGAEAAGDDDPADVLDDAAAAIRAAAPKLSGQQAYAMACKELPDVYAALRKQQG